MTEATSPIDWVVGTMETTDMSETGETKRRFQFTLRALLVATAVISVVISLWAWLISPMTRHRIVRDEMEVAILSLAATCPPELTADQWAYCIGWTWNLHSNYGYYQAISTHDLDQIASGLQERVDQGPDLATIDWVWDQYMESYSPARHYEHYRPTAPENQDAFQSGAHGGNPLGSHQRGYQRRVRQRGGNR